MNRWSCCARLQKNAIFLWLDPLLLDTYYKEAMWKFSVDLEEAKKNKPFEMEILKLSDDAKNNKAVQMKILKWLKAMLSMMVMLLVVLIVMGFMVYNVLVKALGSCGH